MTHTKQRVFLPVKVEDELPKESGFYKTVEEGTSFFQRGDQTWWDNDVHLVLFGNRSAKRRFPEHWLKPQEGYFFTPEQLNQLLSDVIEDALSTAADNAKLIKPHRFGTCESDIAYTEEGDVYISHKSITSTFNITYQKHKV